MAAMLDSLKMVGFLFTTDYERSKAFFVNQLGLTFVAQDQFALVLRCGANMVRVVKLPNFTPAQATVLGWETADMEAALKWLKQKGVTPEKYPWMGGAEYWTAPSGDKVLWFKDPDGNVLSFSQHT
jgi:catechol 2,3-dioxygenase-like lactoylglutathione lyase family enzyme